MNNNIGKLTALALALDYANLSYDEVQVEKLTLAGDLLGVCYEIEYTTVCPQILLLCRCVRRGSRRFPDRTRGPRTGEVLRGLNRI